MRKPIHREPDSLSRARFSVLLLFREKTRAYEHVHGSNGEAKFWLEPQIELAENYGLRTAELRKIRDLIEEHENEIRSAWYKHFRG
jgi:hypothetical protein